MACRASVGNFIVAGAADRGQLPPTVRSLPAGLIPVRPGPARMIVCVGPGTGAAAGGAEQQRAAGAALPADQPVGAGDRKRAVRLAQHRQNHLRHLYAKLGTHRRADTVARARALGLLAPSPRTY
jgi:hypothetical protein